MCCEGKSQEPLPLHMLVWFFVLLKVGAELPVVTRLEHRVEIQIYKLGTEVIVKKE